MLRISMGVTSFEAIHVEPHHLVNFKNGFGEAIKGSILTDYLANQPIGKTESMEQQFPDEGIMNLSQEEPAKEDVWTLVFDGASNALGHGIGVVLVSPEANFIPITARLCFDCTNNIAEYEACAMGLQTSLERKVKILEVYGDSALVIHQLKEEWETRDGKSVPYKEYIQRIVDQFEKIDFFHIPREDNRLADALATLSSMFHISGKDQPFIQIESKDQPIHCCTIETASDGRPCGKREHQENRSEDGSHIQRLTRDATFCLTWVSHLCTHIYWVTPYSLVYGMEAVLPIEVELPSLRIMAESGLKESEWIQARYDQLNMIEEKRLAAICHGQLYQKRLIKAYSKKVRPRHFQEGELVLKKILPIHKDHRGKWTLSYICSTTNSKPIRTLIKNPHYTCISRNPYHEGQVTIPYHEGQVTILYHEGQVTIPYHEGQVTIPYHEGQVTIPYHEGQVTIPYHEGKVTIPYHEGQVTIPYHEGQVTIPYHEGQVTIPYHEGQVTIP
ncbi:hypothetical protein Lal_00001258 [Lupinus albus]|nr:hypothetical protein Lal_00001258 [Lupinus albus]